LSSPGYGTLADETATGTISNDDTRVGLVLRNTRGDRVVAKVDTLSDAPGAVVKVFRVKASGRTLVLRDNLNSLGRINRALEREFKPGAELTLVAVVRTENGPYESKQMDITIR